MQRITQTYQANTIELGERLMENLYLYTIMLLKRLGSIGHIIRNLIPSVCMTLKLSFLRYFLYPNFLLFTILLDMFCVYCSVFSECIKCLLFSLCICDCICACYILYSLFASTNAGTIVCSVLALLLALLLAVLQVLLLVQLFANC